MEIFPSEYQKLDLSKYEKIFVRHANNTEQYGLLLLKINPAMLKGESLHAIVTKKGVLLCKFLSIKDVALFPVFIEKYVEGVYRDTIKIVGEKLLSNKALIGSDDKLALSFSSICRGNFKIAHQHDEYALFSA